MTFAELRDSIRATRDIIYLNTGFTGPSPSPVVERIHEVLQQEAAVGGASPEGLQLARAIGREAQEAVAGLLNVDAADVLITHGTTEGLHVVIYGMSWKPGDELVTCDLEHPALATPASVLEQRFGVIARRVQVPANASNAAEVIEPIVAAITPRTRLVALSHVQFSCGLRLPLREIAAAAHRAGVPVAVDGAQSGGQLAVDVPDLGVDYYSISGQKWLLGPQGTGALYVSPEYNPSLEPVFSTNALAAARMPPTQSGPPALFRLRIASQSPALVAGFARAIASALAIGLPAMEARALALAGRLKGGLATIPGCALTGPTAPELSCGLTSAAVEGWEPQAVVDELWRRWRVAARSVAYPAGIRFSTHAFNTEAEVDRVLEAMATLAKEQPPAAAAG